MKRRLLYFALFSLYLLHNDFWNWQQLRWLGALPAGLAYHLAFCGVASLLMWLLVRTDGANRS